MSDGRYCAMVVKGDGVVLSCRECGALVHHRAVHDAWHATVAAMLSEGLGPLEAPAIPGAEALAVDCGRR